MGRLDDIAIARTLCDYFIDKRVYGQGLDTNTEQGLSIYQRGAIMSRNLTLENNMAGRAQNNVEYWKHIGKKNRSQPAGSGLWCDGSAGMIISLLADREDFKSRLEVVKQADPTLHGHWWVIANRPPASALAYETPLDPACIVIDIWGAIRGNKTSAIGYNPPAVFYDCGDNTNATNALQVVCTVAAK